MSKLDSECLRVLTQIMVRRRQEARDWQVLAREAEARSQTQLAIFFASLSSEDLNRAAEAHALLQRYRFEFEPVSDVRSGGYKEVHST